MMRGKRLVEAARSADTSIIRLKSTLSWDRKSDGAVRPLELLYFFVTGILINPCPWPFKSGEIGFLHQAI